MTKDLTPLTKKQREALNSLNVSDSIRYLNSEGFARADIARILGKRYQHVRNVLVQSTESGERRKTLTVTVSEGASESFQQGCKDLGRHNEKYLGVVLEHGLEKLAKLEPNSSDAYDFLVEYYGEYGLSTDAPSSHVTYSFKLASTLAEKARSECERVLIPFDLFIEAILETASHAMGSANETIDAPFEFCDSIGTDYLESLVVSDSDLEALRLWQADDELLIEAVAEVKKVSAAVAARRVHELTREEKDMLKMNQRIRPIIDRLKSTEGTEISLEDLL